MEISVYTDGGARGNPGPAGLGVVITTTAGQPLYQESKYLGVKTNNEAEYLALIAALTWISQNQSQLQILKISFYSDSQLLVRQINGLYKVKSPHLKPLFSKVQTLLSLLPPFTFQDIRREFNQLADQLANQAMDRAHL